MAEPLDETFTRHERRRQIVTAAVSVIAREGLSAATFARIAAEAGLSSSGLVSYHFASRDDLLASVVSFVLEDFAEARRIDETESAMNDLLRLVGRSVAYVDRRHERVHALSRVLSGWKAPGQGSAFDLLEVAAPLERLLERGVRDGELRPMRCDWVAQWLERSIEAIHDLRLAGRPVEVDDYIEELGALWRAALVQSDAG